MKTTLTDEQYARQLQDEEMALAAHQQGVGFGGERGDVYTSGRYALGNERGRGGGRDRGRGRPRPHHSNSYSSNDTYSNGLRPVDKPQSFFSFLGFGGGARARPRPLGMPLAHAFPVASSSSSPTVVAAQPVHLSEDMKTTFMNNGYLVLPEAVPSALCNEALKYINHHLGNSQSEISLLADRVTGFGSASSGHPSITNLFNSTALGELVFSLLYGSNRNYAHGMGGDVEFNSTNGAGRVRTRGGQIALRYPELADPPPSGLLGGVGWHIDGMDRGQHSGFNLLVGVCLSDQQDDFEGNLCLWPGSHYTLQELISEQRLPVNPTPGEQEDVSFRLRSLMRVNLGEPLQVRLRRGDCVLCHQKVAHRGAPNYGPQIRHMVYFRVSHRSLRSTSDELVLYDLFLHFEGLQILLELQKYRYFWSCTY